MNLRRVHPPAQHNQRRVAPHPSPTTGCGESVTHPQPALAPTATLAPAALRRVEPGTSAQVLVEVAAPARRVAAPVAVPTRPLALSIVDTQDLATGRGLTYEWEYFLADVLHRVADLEAGLGDGQAYRHVQTVPGAVWNVHHNLGYDPAGVLVVSDDGYVLDGVGVQYLVSGQTLRLSTDIAVAGVAYFS